MYLPLQIHRFFVGDVVEKTADAPGITLFLGAAEVGAPVGFCGIVGGIHRHDVCHFGRDMLCGEMAQAACAPGAGGIETVQVVEGDGLVVEVFHDVFFWWWQR